MVSVVRAFPCSCLSSLVVVGFCRNHSVVVASLLAHCHYPCRLVQVEVVTVVVVMPCVVVCVVVQVVAAVVVDCGDSRVVCLDHITLEYRANPA